MFHEHAFQALELDEILNIDPRVPRDIKTAGETAASGTTSTRYRTFERNKILCGMRTH